MIKIKFLFDKYCVVFVVFFLCSNHSIAQNLYQNKKATTKDRVNNLLKRMTLKEKILQLNQYTLGINNNVINIGQEVKSLPPEIGSLIYFSSDPLLRNQIQKKAMEQSRLGIPILFGFDVIHGFKTVYPIFLA